jgi:hypothetical protein
MPQDDYKDLINQFGSNKGTTPIATPYADLINEFGSGAVKAEPTELPDFVPKVRVPLSGLTPEQEIEFYRTRNQPTPTTIDDIPVIREGVKGFKQGGELVSSGLSDISQNRPATGIGKVGVGFLEQAGNVTGILPVIEEGKKQLTKITGNPDFAERATAVATSGLPIAKIGQAVTATMPSTRAINTVIDLVGKENLAPVINKLKSNERLTLMDVDPNVQIIAQGLAAKPGEPRNILDKIVKGRTDSKLDTVVGAIDETMGVPVNVKEKIDNLTKSIQATGKEINPIIKSANPVDLSSVISNIDNKLKPGVNSVITAGEPLPLGDIEKSLEGVRKLLTDDKSIRTNAEQLHWLQSSLRSKAEDLMSSTTGEDRARGRALMNVRNQIVNAIDIASDGKYKPSLAKYRDINDINDAFKKGQLVTRNRLGNLDDDPSYWEAWIKQANPQELEAAKEGARLAVANQMGSVVNAARKGIDIPQIEFNREKLKLLFGKEEVEKMYKMLNDEKEIAYTNSKLFQNSMTAMRLLGAESTSVRKDYVPNFTKTILPVALESGAQYFSGGSLPVVGAAAGIAYPYIRSKITKIGQNLDNKTNIELANLASATGKSKQQLIQALEAALPKPKPSMLQRAQTLALPVAPP